ncbi:MAG: ERF family protein [Pseudomonadota bacterium]
MNKHVELGRFRALSGAAKENANLFSALARARGEFPEIPRRRRATVKTERANYSYMYADLADVFNAVTEPMAAYGLGVWQDITPKGVVTTIYHESGECRSSQPWPIKPPKKGNLDDGQSLQAATQMAKRYSLQSALGISTEESLEGDRSTRVDASAPTVAEASSQGLKDAWIDGVLDQISEDATDREKAEAFAAQIISDFEGPKSKSGVNGVWNKRGKIIDALDQRHNDLFQSVFDAFHARMDTFEEADT